MQRILPRSDTSSADALPTSSQICPGRALLCAVDDPWSGVEEPWSATYEGLIPNAAGGDALMLAPGEAGNLSGAPELRSMLDFCGAGVLGDEEIAPVYASDACDPEVAKTPPSGDQVTITSPLIDAAGADCAAAHKVLDADTSLAISFPIRRAYRDRLILSARAIVPANAPEALLRVLGYEEVRRCTGGGAMSFVVRARDALTVEGLQLGFTQNVVQNAAGRCQVDPKASNLQKNRARPGCTFDNGTVAFRMRALAQEESAPKAGSRFLLQLRSPAPRMAFDANNLGYSQARVLPVQLRYLDVTRELYLVDIHERGLVPIPAGDQPFPPAIDATLTVN